MGAEPLRRNHRFRQAEVTRAIRAAQAAGIEDVRIEIEPDGRIVIVTGKPAVADGKRNSFDAIMGGSA